LLITFSFSFLGTVLHLVTSFGCVWDYDTGRSLYMHIYSSEEGNLTFHSTAPKDWMRFAMSAYATEGGGASQKRAAVGGHRVDRLWLRCNSGAKRIPLDETEEPVRREKREKREGGRERQKEKRDETDRRKHMKKKPSFSDLSFSSFLFSFWSLTSLFSFSQLKATCPITTTNVIAGSKIFQFSEGQLAELTVRDLESPTPGDIVRRVHLARKERRGNTKSLVAPLSIRLSSLPSLISLLSPLFSSSSPVFFLISLRSSLLFLLSLLSLSLPLLILAALTMSR
jgi:hypothetical protein